MKRVKLASLACVALAIGFVFSARAGTPLPRSTPEEQGMDSAGLARLIEIVGTYKQDNLTIIRHGKIVADAYYAPYAAGISHDLRSVTKSIVSTLTAIELKQGLLDSVDHPVLDLFADKHIANIDDNKKAMTVQHLLDMTSGFDWSQGFEGGKEQTRVEPVA